MTARLRALLAATVSGAKGLLFPKACAGCDLPLVDETEGDLCRECRQDLRTINPPTCDLCGRPYAGDLGYQSAGFECSNCADLVLHFDHAIAGYRARGVARDLVHDLKYGRRLHVLPTLGELLVRGIEDPRIRETDEPWLLVPVPLHPKRERKRGFNQADLLMRELVERSHLTERASVLRRVRDTEHQAHLGREERLTNLREAFAMTRLRRQAERVRGRSILLIDDVLTTGTTASECAAVLKEEGGAERVIALTALRG
jgi:ComF family protein